MKLNHHPYASLVAAIELQKACFWYAGDDTLTVWENHQRFLRYGDEQSIWGTTSGQIPASIAIKLTQ